MNETEKALHWIATGEIGTSSKAIAFTMAGMPVDRKWSNHPLDPADLNRCLKLLALYPEWRARMSEVAALSPEWAALVGRWDELEQVFIEEAGIGWSKTKSAPRTYALMRSILAPIRRPNTIRGKDLTIEFGA